MAPLSHIYISTQTTGRETDLLVFGSIISDIRHAAKNEVYSKKIHENPDEIFDFIKLKYPDLYDFGLGIILHGDIFKGADFYSDNLNSYFKKMGERYLLEDVAKFSGIEDRATLVILSHNFIEAAFDLLLKDSCPRLLDMHKNSLESCDFDKVSICLSDYLRLDKEVIKNDISAFTKFFAPKNYASDDAFLKNIVMPIIKNHFKKEADPDDVLRVIEKSKKLVEGEYLGILKEIIEEMKEDFASLI